eukprot:XP_001691199.1 predicted protein [Chlamydomonas reinhardtii]
MAAFGSLRKPGTGRSSLNLPPMSPLGATPAATGSGEGAGSGLGPIVPPPPLFTNAPGRPQRVSQLMGQGSQGSFGAGSPSAARSAAAQAQLSAFTGDLDVEDFDLDSFGSMRRAPAGPTPKRRQAGDDE